MFVVCGADSIKQVFQSNTTTAVAASLPAAAGAEAAALPYASTTAAGSLAAAAGESLPTAATTATVAEAPPVLLAPEQITAIAAAAGLPYTSAPAGGAAAGPSTAYGDAVQPAAGQLLGASGSLEHASSTQLFASMPLGTYYSHAGAFPMAEGAGMGAHASQDAMAAASMGGLASDLLQHLGGGPAPPSSMVAGAREPLMGINSIRPDPGGWCLSHRSQPKQPALWP